MLILYGFTMKSSVDYMLNEGVKQIYNLKFEYVFTSEKSGTPPIGTEQFGAAYMSPVDDDEISFYITGILHGTEKIILKDKSGQVLRPEQNIITAPLAKKQNVGVGDSMTVFDTEKGKEHTFIIEKVAETYAGEFMFIPLDRFNEEFGLPTDAYIGIWSDEPITFSQGEVQSAKSIDAIVAGFGSLSDQMGQV